DLPARHAGRGRVVCAGAWARHGTGPFVDAAAREAGDRGAQSAVLDPVARAPSSAGGIGGAGRGCGRLGGADRGGARVVVVRGGRGEAGDRGAGPFRADRRAGAALCAGSGRLPGGGGGGGGAGEVLRRVAARERGAAEPIRRGEPWPRWSARGATDQARCRIAP